MDLLKSKARSSSPLLTKLQKQIVRYKLTVLRCVLYFIPLPGDSSPKFPKATGPGAVLANTFNAFRKNGDPGLMRLEVAVIGSIHDVAETGNPHSV